MLSLLLLCCSCEFWNLKNVRLNPGQVLERFIDIQAAGFEVAVKIINGSDATLLYFEESNRDKVFTSNTQHSPICCEPNDTSCTFFAPSEFVTPIDLHAQNSSIITFQNPGIQTFVLANCMDTPVTLSGKIVVKNSLTHLDERLRPVQNFLKHLFKGLIIYLAIGVVLFMRSKATLGTCHKLYFVSVLTEILSVGLEYAFLWQWDSGDKIFMEILIGTGIVRAISYVSIFTVTYASLNYPVEIDIVTYLVNSVLLSMIMIGELMGYSDFQEKTSGEWYLGYGSPPCILFIAVAGPCVWLMIQGLRTRKDKATFAKKGKVLISMCVAFICYVVVGFVLMLSRMGSSLIDARDVEWIPFVVGPGFYIAMMIINGWHWLNFNPQAWQTIDNNDNELGVETEEPESLVGTGQSIVPKGPRERPEFVLDNDE